ncbi:hypothetical protein B0H19DRAFT_1059793 [Mycena capillaripes]|nr:hypothetical protein B0H19DRAFT_1059793 [Mycena capillaripes]
MAGRWNAHISIRTRIYPSLAHFYSLVLRQFEISQILIQRCGSWKIYPTRGFKILCTLPPCMHPLFANATVLDLSAWISEYQGFWALATSYVFPEVPFYLCYPFTANFVHGHLREARRRFSRFSAHSFCYSEDIALAADWLEDPSGPCKLELDTRTRERSQQPLSKLTALFREQGLRVFTMKKDSNKKKLLLPPEEGSGHRELWPSEWIPIEVTGITPVLIKTQPHTLFGGLVMVSLSEAEIDSSIDGNTRWAEPPDDLGDLQRGDDSKETEQWG